MTVVEFLHSIPIKNMVSCLCFRPQKVIFLGYGKEAELQVEQYQKLLDEKGYSTKLQLIPIQKNSLQNIVSKLSSIVENEPQCVFDLTGGEDLALVAMGIVYQKYKFIKNLQMHRFDIATGQLFDCDNDGNLINNNRLKITVKDQIMLHGGRMISGSDNLLSVDERIIQNIESLWELCKNDANSWNKTISILSEFEKNKSYTAAVGVQVSLSALKHHIKHFEDKKNIFLAFLHQLHAQRLIDKLNITNTAVSYQYRNATVRSCLQKAGNILEYKTLLMANRITNGGQPYFYDALCGVEMDWDGQTINPAGVLDTRNEIDVFLMKELIPVFISCKNGSVDEDELYKLYTVAQRFGAKYAKKILVATELPLQGMALRFFVQRANDMGITVINNVKYMSDERFMSAIRTAVEK